MGPKKAKDTDPDDNYWRISIEEAQLNDETCKIKVVILDAAGSEQDRIYLNKFENCATQERRFVIKNICKTETMFMINQLGSDKKVQDDNLRVFEEGQSFLKEKKDIPPDILSLIIKHLILKMKNEYLFIKRQRLAVKEGMSNESATMINRAEVRGTVVVKPREPDVPVDTAGKGKGKATEGNNNDDIELDDDKKYNTLLRVRGEEWRDKTYIDDFPIDGPNLYVAITGFLEPLLASSLIHVGVPITAVVQIRIDPTLENIPSSLMRSTKRGQSQTEILGEKCLKFWEEMEKLRIKDESDILKNTAFVVFTPPICEKESLSGDEEKIYDELSYILYDLQDLTRQHAHYLDNLHVISIPQEVPNDILQQIYSTIINNLPLESTTLYSIIDSILNTVSMFLVPEETTSTIVPNSPLNESSSSTQEINVETFVKEVFNTLSSEDTKKKKYRTKINYGGEDEKFKNSIIIDYGDYAKYNTFHIKELDLQSIIRNSLCGLPVLQLWQYFSRMSDEQIAKVNFHVNLLLSCFVRKDVETAELKRLIHILACRKLYDNRSSLKKQHLSKCDLSNLKKRFLKRSVLAEPLKSFPILFKTESFSSSSSQPINLTVSDDKLSSSISKEYQAEDRTSIRLLFECPDLSDLVSAAEILQQCPVNHIIDEYEYFEEFSDIMAFQVINDAYNSFNCIDYKYCKVTDKLILMFFNSQDNEGISRQEWRGHVATPICLQDFFNFILEENSEWIKMEENIYDEIMSLMKKSESKDLNHICATTTCIDSNKVEMDLLMEGSLKHDDFVKCEELETDEDSETKDQTSRLSTSQMTTSNLDSRSSKKTKSTASTPKILKQSPPITKSDSETKIKPFYGYDLCDRRVEAFGKDTIYFSKDGSRIYTKCIAIIPTNVDYVTLSVVTGNGSNEFWFHKVLNEDIDSGPIRDTCESFRISSKDNVSIYIKKQLYSLPELDLDLINSSSHNVTNDSQEPQVTTNVFYSLQLTWPNGHITESVYENNSEHISHIKQFYLSTLTLDTEDMRCISMSGEVIIFKKNGFIEILQPAGSSVLIRNCEKKLVDYLSQKNTPSDSSSEKNKKKGKPKNKVTTISSKIDDSDEEKLLEPKEITYELIIEEFEVTNTDGSRQKYTCNQYHDIEKLLTRTATEYCIGEIYSRRNDGTSLLWSKDGNLIVTFLDKTRIITSFIVENEEIYPEWTEEEIEHLNLFDSDILKNGSLDNTDILSDKEESSNVVFSNRSGNESKGSKLNRDVNIKIQNDGYISVHLIYTIEHPNFATVTINKCNNKIFLDSPNKSQIIIDDKNNYEFMLDSQTNASFDGETLNICYEGCAECTLRNICTINISNNNVNVDSNNHDKIWLTMKEPNSKEVTVNEEGEVTVINTENSCQNKDINDLEKNELEELNISHEKCQQLLEAKSMKFFVLTRDLKTSELTHRALVEDYKEKYHCQQWYSVHNFATFGDYRSMLSILVPVHLTDSEKWLIDSKLAKIPEYLTYKCLKNDDGKGFYHWMRPYKRFQPKPIKPDNVKPPQLPKAYILRTLEQQWNVPKREKLKGAKELIKAILKYRKIIDSNTETILTTPIRDFRSECEQSSEDMIQMIGHKVYEDLKKRIISDKESRAHRIITTEPKAEDVPVGESSESIKDASMEEQLQEDQLKKIDSTIPMRPNLQRYWRRRNEERNEEVFYKYLLREGTVPPYFRNILGGAIWWEMNNVATDAVTKVEERKTKCTCEVDTSKY